MLFIVINYYNYNFETVIYIKYTFYKQTMIMVTIRMIITLYYSFSLYIGIMTEEIECSIDEDIREIKVIA